MSAETNIWSNLDRDEREMVWKATVERAKYHQRQATHLRRQVRAGGRVGESGAADDHDRMAAHYLDIANDLYQEID